MNSVIVFDLNLSSKNQDFKDYMSRNYGFFQRWIKQPQNETIHLPHNIIWKPGIDFLQAKALLNEGLKAFNSANTTNVKIDRYIILNSTPWDGIEGIPI